MKTWLLMKGLPMSSPRIAGFKRNCRYRNLFERVPDVILVLEQLRMGRVFEVEKIGRRKHFQCSTWRIAPRVASAFFRGARASRVLASASSRSRTFSSRTVQKPNLAKQKFVSA